MKFIFIALILFIFIHCKDIIYNHTNKENNLFFVFTTFRHGTRTSYYVVDSFGNLAKSFASLTKYGGLQHLNIRQNYRKRYSNF